MFIAYTFSVSNRSISVGTPRGNKNNIISGVEKHCPCASQTNTDVHEEISTAPVERKIKSLDLLQC